MTHSTLGRPRKVTDAQVSAIMAWFKLPRRGRTKMQVLSLELGVPMATIQYCVAIRGRYKKAGPQKNEHQLGDQV
jgi:hypothetical protein